MLTSMVAMPQTDLIVAALWVGGLSLFLLGQAFAGWVKLRYARRSARHALKLSEATRAVFARPTGPIRPQRPGWASRNGSTEAVANDIEPAPLSTR
jgi:hypothetical protein